MDHYIDILCGFNGISNEFTFQIHVPFHKDSMEQSTVAKHIKCIIKNSANIKNQTLHFTRCHMHKWKNVLTAEPYDCHKITNCPHLIVLWAGHAQSECWQSPMLSLGAINNPQCSFSTTTIITKQHQQQCQLMVMTPNIIAMHSDANGLAQELQATGLGCF